MTVEIDESTDNFISSHRVAHLATADDAGQPLVIPVCYVLSRGILYSALDEKPKAIAARSLRRAKNIQQNPRVSLVIDDYSDDWSQLAYVLISGKAELIFPDHAEHARAVELLRNKYDQYRSMAIHEAPMIRIVPERVKRWQPARNTK
ncbi:MAG TPA: TIGR03668 family PPOX class F420-dependent oxidoreductase [Blastocatellia bacterium]|nr:TIGR03668 family PPOX class F420-dependent oxidoreductase [Blastocatellia bacterium]